MMVFMEPAGPGSDCAISAAGIGRRTASFGPRLACRRPRSPLSSRRLTIFKSTTDPRPRPAQLLRRRIGGDCPFQPAERQRAAGGCSHPHGRFADDRAGARRHEVSSGPDGRWCGHARSSRFSSTQISLGQSFATQPSHRAPSFPYLFRPPRPRSHAGGGCRAAGRDASTSAGQSCAAASSVFIFRAASGRRRNASAQSGRARPSASNATTSNCGPSL